MYDPKDVHVVIFAGGRGARFNNETQDLPKPLIEVAGKPMLGHIMDLYEAQGFVNFTILGGYKWQAIGKYLETRYECNDLARDYIQVFGSKGQRPVCHLFNTGEEATTGDRLFSLVGDFWPPPKTLGGEDFFLLTYGDGVANVDLRDLVETHLANRLLVKKRHSPIVTLTSVNPPGRFGVLKISDDEQRVESFEEKSSEDWINGGFMVVDQGVILRYVPKEPFAERPYESFEAGALARLAADGQLFAYCHHDYWRCMDTRRDLEQIEQDIKENGGGLPWLQTVKC